MTNYLFVHFREKTTPDGEQVYFALSLASGEFARSDAAFHFPYGFKHGTILPISESEYDAMQKRDWNDLPDGR